MDERILFNYENGWKFFNDLTAASGSNLEHFAVDAKVSTRSARSWRAGETSIPSLLVNRWSEKFKVEIPKHQTISIEEIRRRAGSIGGRARIEMHGNLGTPEGRRRGGLNSIKAHRKNETSPFVARKVLRPEHSSQLAELIGAALGDGALTKYQFILYSNIYDEAKYAGFLEALVATVFGVKPHTSHDPAHGVIRIISSRRNIVEHMKVFGLGIGNKTKRQAGVPEWILRNPDYARTCLRGLIDTDGCVYVDRHRAKGKDYSSTCIAFTNASIPLLDFVEEQWRMYGYKPTRSGRDVRLRRRPDVLRYAKEVGFSNPKHSRKIEVE